MWTKKTRSELDLNSTKTNLTPQTDLTKSDQSLWWLEICQKETLVNLKPVNFVWKLKHVSVYKNTRNGFWQDCHSWTNPGVGFQQILFQSQHKSRFQGQASGWTVECGSCRKSVTKNLSFGLQLQFSIKKNSTFQHWGHCQWTKLGAKLSRNFLSNRFSILLQFQKEISYWKTTYNEIVTV